MLMRMESVAMPNEALGRVFGAYGSMRRFPRGQYISGPDHCKSHSYNELKLWMFEKIERVVAQGAADSSNCSIHNSNTSNTTGSMDFNKNNAAPGSGSASSYNECGDDLHIDDI